MCYLLGLLMIFSSPPMFCFPVVLISFSFFLNILDKSKNKKDAFLTGFSFGIGFFSGQLYWVSNSILVFGDFLWLLPISLIIIPCYYGLCIALGSLLYINLLYKFHLNSAWKRAIIFSLCWIVSEIIRTYIPFGFPWQFLGYTVAFSDKIIQCVRYISIYGLSLFVSCIALIPYTLISSNYAKSSLKYTIANLFITLSFLSYGNFVLSNATANEIVRKFLPISGNFTSIKELESNNVMKSYIKNTLDKTINNRIVVWPESAISQDITLERHSNVLGMIERNIDKLIAGSYTTKYDAKKNTFEYWNSMHFIKNGRIIKTYNKNILVPFGEYIPVLSSLGFDFTKKPDSLFSSFSRGKGPEIVNFDGINIVPAICYEILLPNRIIPIGNTKPDVVINISNDMWFGKTIGPHQHYYHAKMRAVSDHIAVIRASNTGITGIFDEYGREVNN